MQTPIALTCGDPAGIGLEIAAGLRCGNPELPDFFLLASRQHVADRCRCPVVEIAHPAQARSARRSGLPFFHMEFPASAVAGQPDQRNAQATLDTVRRAVEFTVGGQACALCTGPVNKSELSRHADFPYPGQTEFIAALLGIEDVCMMLASPRLKVVPATIHVPLAKVPSMLDRALVRRTISACHDALIKDFGVAEPHLAVSGLNPHAGEQGRLGGEESAVIEPEIAHATNRGIRIDGPIAADALFRHESRSNYDAIICMYHDQALVPFKALEFEQGVNYTIGLPIVRTSPGHGTAYDIAGRGKADPSSLGSALLMASQIAAQRSIPDESTQQVSIDS